MILLLIDSAYFWTDMGHIFNAVREFFDYDMSFPHPIGHIDLMDIFCTLSVMYMLADIAESYLGWTGSDGDNR